MDSSVLTPALPLPPHTPRPLPHQATSSSDLASIINIPSSNPTDQTVAATDMNKLGTSPELKGPLPLYLARTDAGPAGRTSASASAPVTPKLATRTPKTLTPRPHTGDSSGSPSLQRSPEMGRPLNVTDALSYLDAVKVQFQDKPDVYNHFLDIMKDFKSQVIDTPGVIERVSMLFHGNPMLIQGFNTFLPLGYRIDISADPLDPNMITVTTPMGTITQSTNTLGSIPRSREVLGPGLPITPHPLPFVGVPHTLPPLSSMPGSRSLTPHGFAAPITPFEGAYSPGFQNTSTTAAASFLGNLNNKNLSDKPAAEFGHAIQYLNKIKARYSDDANTYKQFLEILQTYQKEQRQLHESQVYVQVQVLFKDAPDLLSEFSDFLPDVGNNVNGQNGIVILPHPPSSTSSPWVGPELSASASAEKVAKKAVPPLKRKKRPEKDPTPVPPVKAVPNRAKKPKHHHKGELDSPSFSPYPAPHSPQPAHAHAQNHAHAVMQPPPLQPSQHAYGIPHVEAPHSLGNSALTSADKLLFFDRAKRALESRDIYEEFLKLLHLFSKDIIDVKTLIERAQVFLGDGELLTEFKELMEWDDTLDNVENGPPGSVRTGPPEALSALPADDGQGPSYRRLPDSEVYLACSGRDELCRSVLNDMWVSHPTWASEEAGFLTHKKNSFEDALHKSEEERHEYHVQISALTRTIAILEPLSARVEEMTSEERALFKLKANFGGPGRCIYHRIIKKIYGRDAGLEVIQALQDCPGVAVPVVLARLKQKNEEWRRAQREWSRTWREVDGKNFYKSLDHQGISFKANDKKNITAKNFVAAIESAKADQDSAREHDGVPSFARGSVGYQLEYGFQDTPVLHDSLKMVYSFLDHSQAQYSPLERRSVEQFLRSFIPLLCMYPAAEFNAACGPLEGTHDDDITADSGGHSDSSKGGRKSAGAQSSGIAAGDLRKKLLKTTQEKPVGKDPRSSASAVGSRAASPVTRKQSPMVEDGHSTQSPFLEKAAEDIWIQDAGATLSAEDKEQRPFFANTTFYTLLRLLQLLYSRLLLCKEIGASLAAENHKSLLANPVAVELGLVDPNGPPAILAQAMDSLGDKRGHEDANVVYMYLLDACEKVFDSELDQATFEEHMRWFFGTKAYHVFTLDKLITALVKQVQTILSDNKCQELWTLLQATRRSERLTNQDIIRYRREAECHVGLDDHLYKMEWVRSSKKLRMQLMGTNDPSVDGERTALGRWREYVDTYVMRHPTEWVPEGKGGPVFIRRFLVTDETPDVAVESHTRIRISLGTYKIFYEAGSEDLIWRRRSRAEEAQLADRARVRQEERRRSPFL